jgi:DNA-binding response OmpR family regulator
VVPNFSTASSIADHAGVELIEWPRDEKLRQQLARSGVPRLLLVEADAEAPIAAGLDEDWVRLPVDDRDVVARLERLSRVVDQLRNDQPAIDANNVLHRAGTTVALSDSQAAVVGLLLEHPGRVVDRPALQAALWPDGPPSDKALDGVVFRLRRRLTGVGMVIRSAHARGFVLDCGTDSDRAVAKFTGTDPQHRVDVGDPDLAVADLARARRVDNDVDDAIDISVGAQHLKTDLGDEVDPVLGAAIHLGVPALPSEATRLADGDSGDAGSL